MTDRLGEHTLFEQEHKESCEIAAARIFDPDYATHRAVKDAFKDKYGKDEK